MAFEQVTLNDGTVDHDYDPLNVTSGGIYYRDMTSTLALPKSLDISHQAGSPSKPDRHLIKLSLTDDSTVDPAVVETVSAHVVVSLPRSVVTIAQALNLCKQLADLLDDSTRMTAILNGGFPAT